MNGLAAALGVLVFGIICIGILFGPQLMVLFALREMRKMAEAMPEKDRERWLNDAMTSFEGGLKKGRAR